MARLLALEWDDTEARVAVASSRAGGIAFEHAFAVDLRSGGHRPGTTPSVVGLVGGAEVAQADAGPKIAAALAARRLARIGTLVAVGRSDIELRRLSLPSAPDDELPDMVRFQAMREFNVLGEDWPLDFLPIDLLAKTSSEVRPLGEGADQSRDVLAAAVNPELVDKIRSTCHTAGLKPTRLVLRPCAAASLVCRQGAALPGQVRLLVDLSADEADLTVIVNQRVVFLRRARLHGDPLTSADASEALVSEIRRTVVAAQNQLRGPRVESILLCGAGPGHKRLEESIGDQLPVPLELFDPFGAARVEGDLRRSLPENADRFAPLLGALWDELEGTPHALDFLNPRRRPRPPSRRNTYSASALGVAVVVLLLLGLGWLQGYLLQTKINQLAKESSDLDEPVERAEELQRAVDEIEGWTSTATDIVWLDELRWLSEKFPKAEEAMLTQLTLSISSGRGEMTLDGQARSVDAVTKLDDALQGDSHRYSHRLAGKTKEEDESKKPYPVKFRSVLSLTPKEEAKPKEREGEQ